MSGEVSGGDNPLDHFSPLLLVPLTTTFHHDYGYNDSIKTTFFPLLIVWEGFFYYIYSPDKKGIVSVERGETNVVSVLRVFYPLQGGNRYTIWPPTRWILYPHFMKTYQSGEMWDYTWTGVIIYRRYCFVPERV